MGCAPGVGNGRAGAQADAGELLDQDRERRGLSSVQMIRAGGVDDDSVRDRPRRSGRSAAASRAPALQRLGVCCRIGVLDHQAPHQRLGLGRGHADAQSSGLGRHVRRQDDPSSPSLPTRISGVSGGGAVSPAFRLTRSVDKVGRKTEMTRGIARLQFEICALASAAADQSTSQRARPTPGTGSGVDGSAETRQRVVAAVGWPKSDASVCRLHRLSAMPIVPDPSRSELKPPRGGHGQAATSPTTAPRPPCRRPSSKQARMVFSSPPSR